MEGFLRAYYTNLNPNATEEEIMAFLESQGFGGMGNQPVEGGITGLQQNPILLPQLGGDGDGGGGFKNTGSFGKPPSGLASFLVGLVAPPVGLAMGLRNLASKGRLPFGGNEMFGNEFTNSGINKIALQQGIQSAMDDTDPADMGTRGDVQTATGYSGVGDVGATGANTTGEFATDSASYDL